MSLVLYHFTTSKFMRKIRAEGLRLGRLPWNLDKFGNPEMRPGYQWLTSNPDFSQPWCLLGGLPYPRNAWRITVLIPTTHQGRVHKWSELVRRCRPDSAEYLSKVGGDTENWYVFAGPIPPSWFLAEDFNPGQFLMPEHVNN